MSDFILALLIVVVALCYISVIVILIIGCCKQIQQCESSIKDSEDELKELHDALLARRKYKDLTQYFGENI